MDENGPQSERPWREIAEEVSTCDCDKVAELSQELIDALDRDEKQHSKQTLKREEKQVRRKSA